MNIKGSMNLKSVKNIINVKYTDKTMIEKKANIPRFFLYEINPNKPNNSTITNVILRIINKMALKP